jgi:multiple sugar transport system permease protein
LKFSAFFRGLILISWCVPLTVAALVWRWSLHASLGWINDMLLSLGLVGSAVPFLSHPTLAMISVIVCDIWTRVPFMTLILLAGLQNIPDELGEAATVDGANVLQRFRSITVPMMTPHIFVVLLFNSIFAFRTLAFSYGMTKGGPAQATYLYAQLIYERVFLDFRLGSAAILSVSMFLMTGGIVIVYAALYKLFAPKM